MPDPAAPFSPPAAHRADPLPNLRHLRVFEAAARLGSLTAAAESVHVTQPAASQAVAGLARLFGVRLLDVGPGGAAPTAEGRVVADRTLRALAHLAEAGRRVAGQARIGRALAGDRLERHATLPQLRALAAVAEAGSFSAAARALGQREPAVQRAARELERLIGIGLFDSGFRTIRLTPAGEIVAAHAGLALREIAALRDELRERAGTFDGRIAIGTLPLVRTRIVPDAAVALLARHPGARLSVLDGSYDGLVRTLRSGGCDLIVGALRGPACPAGLVERVLFEDRLAIVARAGHPLAQGTPAPRDLARFPWVLPRPDSPSRAVFDRLAAEHGVADPARGGVETGSLVALRGVLLASEAVALISPRQVDYEIRQGLLVQLAVDVPDSARPIGVTTLADWRPTALQSAFLACLDAQRA